MSLHVRVLLFARAREIAGKDQILLSLEDGATLEDAVEALGQEIPPLRSYLTHCRLAIDEEFHDLGTEIHDNAEVAVIPPVSGGLETEADGESRV